MKTTFQFLTRAGLFALLLVFGQFAHAQTATDTTSGGTTTVGGTTTTGGTVGLPTTGAGGNLPLNIVLLTSSAVLIGLGISSVYKEQKMRHEHIEG